ncbi:MAG: hypothetical protein ACI9IT_001636 [Glaciecola sp.]|jgi:uncharacterized protein (UPF0276 family)
MNSKSNTKPNNLIGVGLRHSHYSEALSTATLADVVMDTPNENGAKHNIDFVEVHAENFFAAGGATQGLIQDIAQAYPLSLHGTSLGLGSTLSVPADILQQFAKLVKSTQPILVSEHLCFNRAEVNGVVLHSGDLLPIPYNTDSLRTIVAHIQQVQESIQRPLLIENLSAYITPSQLVGHTQDNMTEFEFLVSMCEAAGCGILLDLNNLIINELNRKTVNPLKLIKQRLDALPAHIVGEIHLAGYTDKPPASPKDINQAKKSHFIIDDHGAPVSEQCWQLYQYALQKFPGTPTLVEWDTQIPEWSVLLSEADKARSIAEKVAVNSTASSRISDL